MSDRKAPAVLGLIAAVTVALVGVVAAATHDSAPSCGDLRRQLAETKENPLVTSLQTLSDEDWARLGALNEQQMRIVRELRTKECDR